MGGALISFLQKGLQYLGIEENLNEDGTEKRKKRRVNKKMETEEEEGEFSSLLSPTACKALAKRDPPIRLNVPPASAAAAIKAKVEEKDNGTTTTTEEVQSSSDNMDQHRQQAISLLQQAQLQS